MKKRDAFKASELIASSMFAMETKKEARFEKWAKKNPEKAKKLAELREKVAQEQTRPPQTSA